MTDPTQALAERIAEKLWGPKCPEGLNDCEIRAAVPLIAAELRPVVEAHQRIVEKCEQYANAPRLFAAEQHAVNEYIWRAAARALSHAAGEDAK